MAADVISHLNQLVGVRQIETKETAETVEFDQVVQDLPPFLVPALPRSLRHRPVSRVWGFGPQNPGPTYQSVILASLYRRDRRCTVGRSPGPILLGTLDGLKLLLCRATPPPPLPGSLADGLWLLLCRATPPPPLPGSLADGLWPLLCALLDGLILTYIARILILTYIGSSWTSSGTGSLTYIGSS